MRWFKHPTGSHDDPDIHGAIQKFGDAGYSVYFILLEIYSDEYHHKTKEEVRFNVGLLCQKLHKRWTKVELILNYYKTLHRIEYRIDGIDIYIQIPNYKGFMDNWSKRKTPQNSVVTPKKHTTEVEVEVEEDVDKKKIKKKSSPEKFSYGEYVKLTQTEWDTLIKHYGKDLTDKFITKLDLYIGSTGKRYKSHYMTILNWMNKDNIPIITQKLIVQKHSPAENQKICVKCGVTQTAGDYVKSCAICGGELKEV